MEQLQQEAFDAMVADWDNATIRQYLYENKEFDTLVGKVTPDKYALIISSYEIEGKDVLDMIEELCNIKDNIRTNYP